MELLRIVSMTMVLIVHFDGASLGLPQIEGWTDILTCRDAWQLGVESLAIIGVNCFTLISGYFGIRLRIKGITSYLFQCIFYSVGIYCIFCLSGLQKFDFKSFGESFMVLTHTDLWYVPAYFLLMLCAPLLNLGFSRLTRQKAVLITIAFLVFTIIGGWMCGLEFNARGYTVFQLILMYLTGRCIASYYESHPNRLGKNKLWFTGAYLILSFITTYYAIYDPAKAYAYNSPAVILSSIAFTLIFINLGIKDKRRDDESGSDGPIVAFIRFLAKSAFAVYLVHKAPLMWVNVVKNCTVTAWAKMSVTEFSIYIICSIIVIYGIVAIIDILRRFLFAKIYCNFARLIHRTE